MRKMLAVLMTFSMVLAGCMDLTDEDVESIVDSLVDLPGCNDETAYNYDENATNNLACLTEQVLKQSVTDFVNLVDNGPAWNETMGMMMEGSETDSDGMTTTFTTTMAVSPDGMYMMTEMDMGMMVIEIGELMTENADGTTNIQTTWMGNTFQMNTEAVFDDHWNEQSFLEDDDGMGDDDMDMGDDDMDMGLPNTEVEIPNDFDPATALYTAGLSTSNGYSFTTTLEHEGDYTTTMTFTLSTDLAVTSLVMVESYDGMTSTSSITILDAEAADQLLVNDETLVEHALPFTLSPMGGDDHDGHDHGDHDDHDGDDGDHDGHDHGDEITSLEDFDVSSWDSTNDLQQIVDWFNDNYMYEEDETLMQVGDFLSLCDADPDYVDNYVAECVFNSAMNMLHNDDHDGHDHGDDDGDHDDHDDDLITPEQLLADIDSDESGTMSLDEFNAFFGGSEEIDVNDPEFSEIFDNNDADASGDLDSYELEGFIMELDAYLEGGHDDHDGHDHGDHGDHEDDDEYESVLPSDEMEFISLLDVDGSDGISYTEYVQFIETMIGPMTEEQLAYWTTDADEMFGDVDADDSGEVEQGEEYYTLIQELDMIFENVFYYGLDDVRDFACNDGSIIPISSVNDGIDDCPDGEDEVMDDDGHDDHDMMIYECLFIVATNSIVNDENGQPDFASSWDGTNLDTTLCDTVVENHDDYYINFEEGTLELPTELYVWDLDEEDGDMVMLMDLISDNGITITMDGVPVDECEGTFNADENSCTMETGTMVVASNDSMMIWLNSEEGEEMIVLYQFDSTTNSGVMMGLVTEDDDHDDNDDHDDHDGHDHDDNDDHDDHDGHDHDDHMMAYDWMINTADMMSETEVIGAYADYHIVLANCVSESSDDMMGGETLSCGDDVLKVTIAEATAPGAEIMFHDADMSGTITAGDMVHINPDIDAGGEWNTVRLYSVDADKYSDENPMMTPGFGAFAGIVALLGAALLTRRD